MRKKNQSLLFSLLGLLCIYNISLIIVTGSSATAQTPAIEELTPKLNNNKDSTQVKLLIEIAADFAYFNPDTAIYLEEKARAIAKEIGYTYAVINTLINQGLMEANSGKMKEARVHLFQGLDMAYEYADSFLIGNAQSKIGVYYFNRTEYDSALVYYFKSLKEFEKVDEPEHLSVAYNNIGNVFLKMLELEKAKTYLEKAQEINIATKDSMRIAATSNNLGIICTDLEDYEGALKHYLKAADIAKAMNHLYGLALTTNNVGDSYRRLGQFDKALEYLFKALEYKQQAGDQRGAVGTLRNIGFTYHRMGNNKDAIEYLQKAIQKGESMGERDFLSAAYDDISRVYASMKSFEDAYKYQSLFQKMSDTIMQEEKQRQILELETQYQTEKKQLEIEKLEQQKVLDSVRISEQEAQNQRQLTLIYSFIAGFVIILVFSILLLRLFIQKRKANQLLFMQNEEIKQKNEEITSQRDEIEAQRDTLNNTLIELRETQDQLIESEKMASLGNLVMGMAHEMNTPLGVGITASSSLEEITREFAGLYKQGNMTRQQLEEFLNAVFTSSKLIKSNLDRTGKLVQTFKMISVDQQGEAKNTIDMASFVDEVMLTMKSDLDAKNVKVNTICHEKATIETYTDIWASILHNLTMNSIKHGFTDLKSPELSVEIEKKGNLIEVVFADNGSGIAPDNISKVFDPFFTTNKQLGAGLGLSIVYNLVTQKLKGKISCQSDPGVITKFIITIPVS